MNDIDKGRLKIELLEDMKRRPYMYSPEILGKLFNGVKDRDLLEKIKEYEDDTVSLLRAFILSDQTLEHKDLVIANIIPEYLSVDTLLKQDIRIYQNHEIDNHQECIDVIFLGAARSGKSIVLASIMEQLRNNTFGYYEPSPITNRYYDDLLSCFQKKKFPCGSAMGSIHYALYDIPRKSPIRIISPGNHIIRELGNNIDPDYIKTNNRKIVFFIIDSSIIERKDGYYNISSLQIDLINCLYYLCHNGINDSGHKSCTMSNVCTLVLLFTQFDVVGLTNKEDANDWMEKQIKENLLEVYYRLEDICHQYAINSAVGCKPLIMKFSVGKVYIGNTFDYDSRDANNLTQFILSQIPSRRSFWNILNNKINFLKK